MATSDLYINRSWYVKIEQGVPDKWDQEWENREENKEGFADTNVWLC